MAQRLKIKSDPLLSKNGYGSGHLTLPAMKPLRVVEIPAEEPENSFNILMFDLEHHHCRYPKGDPQNQAEFRYCGAPRMLGKSYCPYHDGVVYKSVKRIADDAV